MRSFARPGLTETLPALSRRGIEAEPYPMGSTNTHGNHLKTRAREV
jgi:hypothetical protein